MKWLQLFALVLGVGSGPGSAWGQAPDFHLLDVSSESPRRQTVVSPRDYIMQVSGYYFTQAT
jgi:hypothetical protein